VSIVDIATIRLLDAQHMLEGEDRRLTIELVQARIRMITDDITYKIERRGEMIELLDDLRFGRIQPIRVNRRGVRP